MTETPAPPGRPGGSLSASDRELVLTLFELSREVTGVLTLEELLPKIPQLIARLIEFQAFAVYLLDAKKRELRVAYSVGYPEEFAHSRRLKVGEGIVGTAVAEQRELVINDVHKDPRYVEAVPGSNSELVVPLRRKGATIGALNVLSRAVDQYTDRDAAILSQFGAQVAVALENAKLFDREREYSATLETLAEIGKEVAAILDLEELLARIAKLARRVIDYRTFGIMLLNETTSELEMKLAIRYGDKVDVPHIPLGAGLVGYAALHKEPVLVPDVSLDPRYIKVVDETKSELVIPLLLKDRCIGVFDLESPEVDAFHKSHVEILTLLASQAAVAIENARLYKEVRANELRLERELSFARRVQDALLPTELPVRMKGVDVAAKFAPARELGGDFYDFLTPLPGSLVVAVGDVSGKGVPAALYSAFAGELVRSRTFRRRYAPNQGSPALVLGAMNTILFERQLEGYYCTLCYASFDLKKKNVTIANSGLPYPIRVCRDSCAQIMLPGLPLGLFAASTYEEVTYQLHAGDTYVFCSDGVSEAMNVDGEEFGSGRLVAVVESVRAMGARDIVDMIFDRVEQFRGDAPPNDDMTAVAVKITV